MNGQSSDTWTFSTAAIWIASRDRVAVYEFACKLQDLRENPHSSAALCWKDLKEICEALEHRKGGSPWVTSYKEALLGLCEVLRKGSLQAEGISRQTSRLVVIDVEIWRLADTPYLDAPSPIDSFDSMDGFEVLLQKVRLNATDVENIWPLTADFEVGLWDLAQVLHYLKARTEVGLPRRRTFAPASDERWTRANPKSQHEQQIDDFLQGGKLTAYYRLQRFQGRFIDAAEGQHRSQRSTSRVALRGRAIPPGTWVTYSIIDKPNALFDPNQVKTVVGQRDPAKLSPARLKKEVEGAIKAGAKSGNEVVKRVAEALRTGEPPLPISPHTIRVMCKKFGIDLPAGEKGRPRKNAAFPPDKNQ